MASAKELLVQSVYSEFSFAGVLGTGSLASRRMWDSTTAVVADPTDDAGKETHKARTAVLDCAVTGGTSGTFEAWIRYAASQTWARLLAFGGAGTGSKTVGAGDQYLAEVTIPCGVDRIHVKLESKVGLPTACVAYGVGRY